MPGILAWQSEAAPKRPAAATPGQVRGPDRILGPLGALYSKGKPRFKPERKKEKRRYWRLGILVHRFGLRIQEETGITGWVFCCCSCCCRLLAARIDHRSFFGESLVLRYPHLNTVRPTGCPTRYRPTPPASQGDPLGQLIHYLQHGSEFHLATG